MARQSFVTGSFAGIKSNLLKQPSGIIRPTRSPGLLAAQRRSLSIHEYQSQDLLNKYGLPVPRAGLARTPEEAASIAKEFGQPCVLKSQVLAGGRGKGTFDSGLRGGIQTIKTSDEAKTMASKMLGHRLVTKQTSTEGLLVDKINVAEIIDYKEEYYVAMTIDRAKYCPALIISKQGGVNVEAAKKDDPNHLASYHFNLTEGLSKETEAKVAAQLKLSDTGAQNFRKILRNLTKVFREKDATLLEINPLVRTESDEFYCLDAKCSFDNAAEKRQKEIFSLRNRDQEIEEETEAEQYGLVYVRLDGNIGNIVNGAGLAMATNDAIAHYGGQSANFLDTGGQATVETVQKALELVIRDTRVKAVLVNIYGGIIRCDMIAEAIIAAAKALGDLRVPVVVRLQGTNSEQGLKLIEESGLGLQAEFEFGDAAEAVVELAKR